MLCSKLCHNLSVNVKIHLFQMDVYDTTWYLPFKFNQVQILFNPPPPTLPIHQTRRLHMKLIWNTFRHPCDKLARPSVLTHWSFGFFYLYISIHTLFVWWSGANCLSTFWNYWYAWCCKHRPFLPVFEQTRQVLFLCVFR